MKNVLNFLITLAVFYLGNKYCNEYISINNDKTLLIASILMLVFDLLYGWLLLISFTTIIVGVGCVTTPVLIMLALVLTPMKLWILSHYLPGFHIHGFWTYVILTFIFFIFLIKSKSKSKS